jgi:ABC-type polysaccharide transport system, permease component
MIYTIFIISIIVDRRKGDRILKKDKLLLLGTKGKILFDMILLGILTILCYIAPFASYTYKRESYTITGIEFLTGKEIMGKTVTVHASFLIWIYLFAILLLILLSMLFSKLKTKTIGAGILLLGIVTVVINVIFSNQVSSILSSAKDPKVAYGSIILLILSIIIVIRGFHILYQVQAITALDFMVLPGLVYIIINNYLPMFGILLAFKKINFAVGLWKSEWIGLSNFKYLFTTSDAFIITRNTILYNLVFIIVGNVMGIMVGICLSEILSKRLQKFFQTTILLPQLISMIIVAYIVYGFISNESGWINNVLLGQEHAINFYATKTYWPFLLVFVNTWKGLGYSSIIFMSSIIGIDKSLYEASYVDGCGRWKQIKCITLPLLKPTIITLGLIQVGRIFYSDFGLFYQVPMDSGALYSVTQTIDTYVYHSLMKTNNISMASAASAYQSIIGFVIIMVVNAIVRKADKENALF